jgi:probable HAF family extracellular repeat protein
MGLGFLPGGSESVARAVSADGSVVVGYSDGSGFKNQAFRWLSSTGAMAPLGFLPGSTESYANGVSANGSVVVGYSNGPPTQAFLWVNGTMYGLGSLPGLAYSVANAASADGSVVVGQASDGKSFNQAARWRAATGMLPIKGLLTAAGILLNFWTLDDALAVSPDGRTMVGTGANPAGAVGWIARLPLTATLYNTNTHDFGGDRMSDIAWRQSGGTVGMWLMNGAQVAQSGGFGVVPTNWQLVGPRDFNGDGKPDLRWRDANTGTVAIWLMNGLQIPQSGSFGAVPGNWIIAGTGDFNGDGMGDILWFDTNTGTVAVWLLNGLQQVLQSGSVGSAVPGGWAIAGTGDFNGDGMADVLWRDLNTGTVAIWLMNGLQSPQVGGFGPIPANWSIVGTGDFNGDGKWDVLWRDSNTGTVSIWLLNGFQILQTGNLGALPSNWIVAEVGDFNGDGFSDILWRDTNTGAVAIWFMNGTQVASTANVGTITLDWIIQGLNAD